MLPQPPIPIEVVALAGVVALVGTFAFWGVRWLLYRNDGGAPAESDEWND